MSTMQALMRTIQKAAAPNVWSAGVELCRASAVAVPTRAALQHGEVEVQVAGLNGAAGTFVTLWPEDGEWACACPSRAEVCQHAAAAAIACNQVASGRAPPAAAAAAALGHIAYRFEPRPLGLTLTREVISGAAATRLHMPVVAYVRAHPGTLLIQPHDQTIDTLLVSSPQGPLPAPLLARVLRALRDAPHVTLGAQPVTVSGPKSAFAVALSQRPGGGILARLSAAEGLVARYQNGAALFGHTLVPQLHTPMPDAQRRGLTQGVVFPPERLDELHGALLPGLAETLPIYWGGVARREQVHVPPALGLTVGWQADEQGRPTSFTALALVVYGAPPIARVVGGTLRAIGQKVPKRLLEAEAALEARLDEGLQLRCGHRVTVRGAEGVALVRRIRAQRAALGLHIDDPQGALDAFTARGTLTPQLRIKENDFDLTYALAAGEPFRAADTAASSVASSDVHAAWDQHDRLIGLAGGGFAALPADFLQVHGDLVRQLLEARRAGTATLQGTGGGATLPPWALPHLGALAQATGTPLPLALAGQLQTLSTSAQAPRSGADAKAMASLPKGIVLRPYQVDGIAWLKARLALGLGVLLADDMGLGKTLQALLSRRGRTLVVAPTSVVFNWAEEAARMQPGTSVLVYHGSKRTLTAPAELTITSYGLLRQDGPALIAQQFDTVILDEAQVIKNTSSQVAQAAYALGVAAKSRLALTGTPVENRLEELWSQCHFLNPGMLGSLAAFKQHYADPMALGTSEQAAGSTAEAAGAAAAQKLRQRLAPMMLRRTKAQVAQDLPPRTDVVLRCSLTDAERAVYKSVQAATQAHVIKLLQEGGSVMQALEALLRLRQAACHSGLVPGHEAPTSSKMELLKDTLATAVAEGHRALVFSQWTSLLDRVEPHLRAENISYLRLDGSTQDRGAVVRRFVADGGPSVLLISLRAGGVGLNLTAADHVFLLDPWWNPAVEDQAADRAHRMGQQRPVLVHRLVAQDTVEEQILRLQGHKRALAEAALSGDTQAPAQTLGGGGLTRADVLGLLSGCDA